MSERITITIDADVADAIVHAANCFSDCCEGNIESVMETWMPHDGPDQGAANAMLLEQSHLAQEGAQILREELDGVHKRDPQVQMVLHHLKMFRKYGVLPRIEDN
jgi:hypothetical protein